MQEYRKDLSDKKRIVVKIGTSSLTYPNGKLNFTRIEKLVQVLSKLYEQGKDVLLVSSGAIAIGSGKMGLSKRPDELAKKQAMASIGQTELMKIYQKFFGDNDKIIAQILLTKDVLHSVVKKTNAINTFSNLMDMRIIPIINENDTISTDEIEFGDNDTLSAYVSTLVNADLLIMLSDIEGLFTADPKKDPTAELIPLVDTISPEIEQLAGSKGSSFGTGGMVTKITAAKIATRSGIDTIITDGEDPTIIFDILAGGKIGTLFQAKSKPVVTAQ